MSSFGSLEKMVTKTSVAGGFACHQIFPCGKYRNKGQEVLKQVSVFQCSVVEKGEERCFHLTAL